MDKVIRYVRVNSRTWVGTRLNIPDEQVIRRFHENLRLSPYFNPKKFFTIK